MLELRSYQQEGISDIYSYIREGYKNIFLWGATGSGKSITFSKLSHDFFTCGLNVVIAVKRRDLISQASAHLTKWKIPHGVWMAKHHRFSPKKTVQVCSIDTLNARSTYPFCHDPNTIVIVDECHDATPQNSSYKKFFIAYKDHKIIGLTATPFSDMSMWEVFSQPIDGYQLMLDGHLVPEKTYVPNHGINLDGISLGKDGDYDQKQLAALCSKSQIVGDIIEDWKQYGQNRRTILFAVNVEHSKLICSEFNKAGIKAVHCDASSSEKVRKSALRMLHEKEVQVVCNVNIFSTGVDEPSIECISFCRPTMSVIYWLQAIGRGLRPSPLTGKQNCIIIDHAGNTLRHGSAYSDRQCSLEAYGSGGKKREEGEIQLRTCDQCFYIFEASERTCPECGFFNAPIERKISQEDGELIEYEMTPEELKLLKSKAFHKKFHQLDWVRKTKGFGTQWVFKQLKKSFSNDECREFGVKVGFPANLL